MRAWSSPGLDREGDAAEDLAVVDGDVEVVDLERRGGGIGGGCGGHGGHCNNTTAVVEIPGRLTGRAPAAKTAS